MCDCFHLAFPNWHAASSGTGAGRRLRGPEPGTEDDSICDEPSQFTGGERPRPQGSSPVEEFPETEKYTDSDKECEAEHDPQRKSGSGKKTKKSGLGSMFEKRSTPKMSKLKEVHSPESEVIVKTAKDGCAEGLIYGGGGKDGIFIKEVVPESPASKSLKLKEGDQILSATVYFDNVSYEDAIQILEHAQAYKVKLCLKRKPDITETEPAMESDVIPEEELYAPEMREQGKTKRRGDARISWPKFPSFGKGKGKSRFTRSHSSSEADEQRKLELSPTTSDTESPIKSQDALKGKKRHKMKLSLLTKRGRISSSEDQDTDTATTGQISGNIHQTHEASDMLSPECLESPSGEPPEVYVTEDLKVVEDLRPQTVQHKVELITIDSTLKTADLTVALGDKEKTPGIKSPDGKKKKKERSELKMKILGKDKSHKKDAKAKSSPKRLKTLGASIEIADQAENETSDVIPSFESQTKLQGDQLALDAKTQIIHSESSKVISAKSGTTQMEMSVPKVELNISDVAFIQKSPQKSDEKTKKGKDVKQKQDTKTSPTFKLPKISLSDIANEETIQKMNVNVEECTTKIEQLSTEGGEVKRDPYERLSKSGLSRTQLPKREDIEIPGMEDMSMRTSAKGIKEPKAVFSGHYEEIQAETVPLSIDVDSVKEAVSKLPGFKLPKVDTSGVPIPEEITVIDANAQRISVKTPTKVVDTKTKHEAHFTKFDITASPEISKTTVKLPKMTPADLTSEELLIETMVDFKKPEKKYKTKAKQSDSEIITEVYKREDIIIPGKESTQEAAFLQTQESAYESTATLSPKESDKKSKKSKITTPGFGIAKPDIKIPDIGIDLPKQNISKSERTLFLQEVETNTRKGKGHIGGLLSDVKIPDIDAIEYIDSAGGSPAKKDGGIKPKGFGVNLDAAKPNADISFPEIRAEVKDVEAEEHTIKLPTFGAVTPDLSVHVPDADKDINIDGAEIKGKGSKFKMPNIGISMPKVKGPKIDLSQSKKDVDVTLPEAKAEVKLPEVPEVDVTLKPGMEIKALQTEHELDGQGSKFKMPKFGIKMPKIKGPEFDLSVSKKDVDVTLPKAEVKLPDVEHTEPGIKVDAKTPEIAVHQQDVEGSSKFKMPTFKLPKFGVGTPDVSMEVCDMDKDVKIEGADINMPEKGPVVIEAPSFDIEGPSVDMKTTGTEYEGKGTKFKMPHLGFSIPKDNGPQINLSLSKKDIDVTQPEVKLPEVPEVDVTLGNVDVSIPEQKMEVEKPGIEIKPLHIEHELDGQGSKFKMPKFGIKMPKIKGPDFDSSLSRKDIDVQSPEAEVKFPYVEHAIKVEAKAPEITVHQDVEGSSKFKMPTFKLPKFGLGAPNVSVEVPDMDKDVKIEEAELNIPEEQSAINIAAPSIDIEAPSIDMKTTGTEQDGKGSKFKMPHLGFSMPKVKGPKIDLSLPKKGVDITLPEAKADVKLPDVNLGKVDVSIPEAEMEVKKPELEMQSLQAGGELDGQGEMFKMPKFGIKIPKVKGPEIDLSLSKKDVDVTLPQTKVGVKLPDSPKIDVSLGKAEVLIPEAKAKVEKPELEIKPLQTEAEGQGSTFKKFGMSMPKVKGPEFHLGFSKKDVDVTLPEAKADADVDLEEPSAKVEIKAPEIEVVAKDTQGFKMPNFSFSMPKVKRPDTDLGLSKRDTDITLQGTKAEVKLPGAPKVDASLGKAEVLITEGVKKPDMEIKPLETDVELEGQEGKFKMPKFGITIPKVKGPDIDLNLSKKDVDVTLPEAKVRVKLPDVELKEPSARVEIKDPEIEAQLDVEGSPSKFKLPTYNLPKFGAATANVSAEVPDMDLKVEGAGLKIPKNGTTVDVAAQSIDIEGPSIDMKMTETDGVGKESRFKMPKFGISLPKVQRPDINVSLSKKDVDVSIPEAKIEVRKPELEMEPLQSEGELDGQGGKFQMARFGMSDVDITLPEAKAEVNLPDVEFKEPSAKVEVKAPEVQLSSVKGSPSKFKLPTFKFPKFGVATPNFSAEVPDIDKEIKVDGADMHISVPDTGVDVPQGKAEVHLPEVEVKEPSGDVVTDQQPGVEVDPKLKKRRFSLPRFSFSKSVKAPEVDVSLRDVNVAIPEGKVEVKGGEVDMKVPASDAEVDGQGGKIKIPKFGISMPKVTGPEIDLSLSKKDVDVTLPKAKVEVQLPDVELKEPSAEVKIKAPEIKVATKDTEGSPSKFKMPTFTLPKFGVGSPSATVEVPDTDKDVKIDGADIKIPEEVLAVDIAAPSVDIEGPSIDMKTTGTEHEGKGSKFKMPKFGISMPKVTGPEIDLSLSKKDVDVTLPKVTAEVQLPDAELKEPSAEVKIKAPEIKVATKDTEGSPSKFKMPTFTLPKFGVGSPSATVEVPDTDKDVKIDRADIKIPEEVLAVDIAAPSVDIEGPSIDMKTTGIEHEGKGSKFKMPKFGISMPKVTGPEIDLSLSKKDVDVTLPKAKAEVQVPDVELKKPSAEVKIKAPEIKVVTKDTEGSPSKFKMPTFTLPKFGVGTPSASIEVPDTDKDVKIDGADIEIPEEVLAVDIAAPSVEGPSIDMKTTGTEHEGKGSKFKMPKFGISMPKVTGPEIDLSLSNKDVDVTLPKAKAEVQVPDVELKKPSAEVKIKAPEIKATTKDTEGSPSKKFKMPTFKLPKFGVGSPSATVEVPDTDKDVKIDGADIKIPEEVLAVDIAAPSVDIEGPSIDMKTKGTEHEGKGSTFKMPKFGISMPKVTGPDIDLSLSKKDVDVTLPKAKVEVQLPDAELKEPSAEVKIKAPEIKVATKDTEGSPSKKFKMPTFTLPKFGVGTPSATVEVPDTDKDVKIDGADIKIPEEVLAVDIAAPSIDIEGPSIDMKTTGTEHEGKGSKFKMPTFGISMPKVTGPEIDLSLSKKDVDVTLPKAKAEVQVPDVELKKPSAEVKIKAPEIKVVTKDTEGSPSKKFKMPTFKLPKFGVGSPSASVEVPDTEKDVKIDGADIKIPEEVLAVDIAAPSVDIEGPSIDMKTTGTEYEGKGSKFKMPKFGISMPKVTGPEIDLSLSKKDVDVTLPKAKTEVQLPDAELKEPSAEVKIKAPEIKVATKDTEGSPSKKFKMPTFKLPKFGVGSPSATVEVPDTDKDVKIDGADIKIPEEVLAVDIASPSVDIEGPSIDMKTKGTEHEGKGSKFKMPKFGISMPKVTGPDIDLSLSKKDVDVTLPKAKVEVQLPDAELKKPSAEVKIKAPEIKVATKDTEGSPSKFKMPTFTLPKFGVGTPSATIEVPDMDKDVKIDGADIKIPEEVLAVDIAAPSVEGPSIDVKTTGSEHEGKGSKFKMPKFGISMPKVTGPEIDLSLSKKDVDVTLPKAKAEVQVPDVELKKPSAEVEIKAPEIKVTSKDTEGSPSKFKMPTFKLPKFGVGSPSASIEVPDTDKDVKIDGADIKIPEEVLAVDIAAPSVDIEGPSIDMKTKGSEHEGKGSKFKMPKFGISMPKVTGPEIDLSLSKKDVDVTLPKAKAEVQLPDVDLKEPSAEVKIKAPEIKVATKDTEGSPSKFKMPTFTLPKFGVGSPSATVEVPDTDKDVKIDGADIKIPVEVLAVDIAAPSVEGPSIDMKTTGTEHEGKGSKFKMPKFGISMPKVTGPEIDLTLSKKDVDVTLPKAKAEVQLPDVELKKPSAEVEIKAPGIDVQTSNVEGSPSKFQMPTFKLPKFGVATPQVSVEVPDVEKVIQVDGGDLKSPQTKAEVKLPNVEIKESASSISVSQGDANLKKTKFSFPKFSFSKQSTKETEVDVSLPDVDVSLPEGNVEVKHPEVKLKSPEGDVVLDGQDSKFKMPNFGFSMPKVKGPEMDLSLSKKDVDVTLPEAKAEVQLPGVKIKQPSAKVEIKAPEIGAQTGDVGGSPSKLKMPTFTLPKFGVATPKVSVEVPDVEKDIKIDGAKLEVLKDGATVDVTTPSIDTEGLSVDVNAKGSEPEGSGSKFKMPKFGISMPKVTGPEIDLSLSKKDADVTLPEVKAEVKLPTVEVKEPEGAISVPDAPTVEVDAKSKRPNWTFPKFSFSRTGGKAPDVDVNLETPKVDVTTPEVKEEVCLPDVEVQGPSGAISVEEPLATELNANLRKPKFSLPRFSFSKSSVKEPEASAELPYVDGSLPEGEVKVKQPEMEIKAPELEAEHDGQGSKFKLPKFGITIPKGPEDLNASEGDVDITRGVQLPEIEVKESSASVEVKSKDVGGSPLKFKMPTLKIQKEVADADKVAETDRTKLKEDVTVNIKGPSLDIKTDVSKAEITDSEMPKTETDSVGSPSKFKLPSFKMPKLSFSRPKVEDEYVPVDGESKEDQLEMEVEPKAESKSPKMTLTSFGEILKNIDVEFDVSKTDKVEENLETSKEVHETDESSGKQLEAKERETSAKQDTTKSPERTGWFKFPRFGLSSPSEPAKKSPVGETMDEEISPTCSVQSSDAFADISSAMTSEHVGLSLSSPTKVTVKYSDTHTATDLGDMHGNIITSTTRTELISVEPNLPEKITILSSGVSSSSEDTLRLESGKIHVITSNIQATPEAQHARLLTAVQIQSAGGLPLKSEANEAASWTVEDSQSGRRTVFERHLVRETSSERSESKQTTVITKQITRMFDSSEPISGETASSIQRLRDSVHSEKMRFFDGAEK